MGIRAWGLAGLAGGILLFAAYSARADGPATAPAALVNDVTSAANKIIGDLQTATQPATQATTQASTQPSIVLEPGVAIRNTAAGAGAREGDTVYILYTGRLQSSGVVFDSTSNRRPVEPIRVELGSSGMIPGFWKGIIGMQIGDKRTIDISPEMAYADNPPPGTKIPKNAALEFDVELVGISRPLPSAGK